MSAEERWADRMEWAEEKRRGFDYEINDQQDVDDQNEICHVSKCGAHAVKLYEIKKVGVPGRGHDVLLCADHDHEDTAWDIFNEQN